MGDSVSGWEQPVRETQQWVCLFASVGREAKEHVLALHGPDQFQPWLLTSDLFPAGRAKSTGEFCPNSLC